MLGVKKEKDPVYIFYSGKGGVGKTSIAAATALYLSRGGKRVLIVSTDPAHSLSDSFNTRIGGEIKRIEKNLFAVEIDPEKAMQEYKERFMPQIEKISYLKGLGLEDTFDFAGMTPGIDEIAAFDRFLRYMNEKDYDIIVFDTAPTGHTLRFLSLPDVLDSWVGKMISFRMKFMGIANVFRRILPFGSPDEDTDLGAKQLEEMRERIERAKAVLTDPKKTHYNIVMIPEEMSIAESARCIKTLEDHRIPVDTIIVNQLIPDNPKCSFCTERRQSQQERMKKIEKNLGRFRILHMPLFREEVQGLKMLELMGKRLYGK